MDATRFDHWTRSLSATPTRRQALASLFLGAITLFREPGNSTAGPGCKDVGKKCKKKKDCCSGICKGKKGKKRCKAHDTGGCKAGQNIEYCGGAANVPCTTSAGIDGYCRTTTGNGAHCGTAFSCFSCQRDVDCVPICGPKAACIACANCVFDGSTACASIGPGNCAMV